VLVPLLAARLSRTKTLYIEIIVLEALQHDNRENSSYGLMQGYMVPHCPVGFLWLQPNCHIFKKLVGCRAAIHFQALFLLP